MHLYAQKELFSLSVAVRFVELLQSIRSCSGLDWRSDDSQQNCHGNLSFSGAARWICDGEGYHLHLPVALQWQDLTQTEE